MIVVIIAIIGGTCWFVWHKKQDKIPASTATSNTKPITLKTNYGFSFSYPSGWSITSDYSAANSYALWQISKLDPAKTSMPVNDPCVELVVSKLSDISPLLPLSDGVITGSTGAGLYLWNMNESATPSSDWSYGLAETHLYSPGLDYVKLANGMALLANASFRCAEGMTSNLSYDQQFTNVDYQRAVSVLKSVKMN